MTSSTEPGVTSVAATLGHLEVPCECPGSSSLNPCPHHAGRPCEAGAQWMISCRHASEPGEMACRLRVAAICDPCLTTVRLWAEQTVAMAVALVGGRCPMCGGPIQQVSDLIAQVVGL